jgi:HPt (histidine-containing phosphotransfer) domain-containing protein
MKPIRRQNLLDAIEKYSGKPRAGFDRVTTLERMQPDLDERLRAIVPAYLEGRRRDMLAVLAAVNKGDYEQIRAVGHKMRGSGAGYGFADITAIGQRLELAAESRDAEKVRNHVADLSEYLDVLERAMQRPQ